MYPFIARLGWPSSLTRFFFFTTTLSVAFGTVALVAFGTVALSTFFLVAVDLGMVFLL